MTNALRITAVGLGVLAVAFLVLANVAPLESKRVSDAFLGSPLTVTVRGNAWTHETFVTGLGGDILQTTSWYDDCTESNPACQDGGSVATMRWAGPLVLLTTVLAATAAVFAVIGRRSLAGLTAVAATLSLGGYLAVGLVGLHESLEHNPSIGTMTLAWGFVMAILGGTALLGTATASFLPTQRIQTAPASFSPPTSTIPMVQPHQVVLGRRES